MSKKKDLAKFLQVTFSEKGTEMTSQIHILKFDILSFFNRIHRKEIFQSFFSSKKFVSSLLRQKFTVVMDLLEKLRISNFEIWNWDVI